MKTEMIKLALGMIVFQGMPFVEGVLETWYPHVDQIIVCQGPVRFWRNRGYLHSTDGTLEFLQAFRDVDDPEKKLTVVHGMWEDKLEMCNAWAARVRNSITHVACFDADEFMLEDDIQLILGWLSQHQYDSIGLRLYSFVGGFDHYLTGFEEELEVIRFQRFQPGSRWKTHRPPTLLPPSSTRSWKERGTHLSYETLDDIGIRLYHYSHVLPVQIWQKEKYYADYMGQKNVIPHYYDKVWLPWVQADEKGKFEIEDFWDGIHDFSPRYRNDCYSAHFRGQHPRWIEQHKDWIMGLQRDQIENRDKWETA